jgi:glyoxylase-like metal-dependent hydrolase (beta-lactamase superfamily II)
MPRIVRVLAPNPGLRELDGTNTWVVGRWPAAVIDPGVDDRGHLAEVLEAAGRIHAILLTHDHPDHSPGAATLAAWTGAPVLAAGRAEGRERLRGGQAVRMPGVDLTVVATPGHTPDHVAFFLPEDRALFTGDTVLGRGTSVIDPPEGDLTHYLRSLQRLRELEPRTIHPGHGPVVLDAMGKLDEYLAHRQMREEQVLAGLAEDARTPEWSPRSTATIPPSSTRSLRARCSRTC